MDDLSVCTCTTYSSGWTDQTCDGDVDIDEDVSDQRTMYLMDCDEPVVWLSVCPG